MKDIENPDGTKTDKVKIIRNDIIGQYSWDNKPKGTGSSTSEYGSNDWSDSALQKVLNEGVYYNRENGYCPYGGNKGQINCNFSKKGLTNESKKMISESVWNLGGSSKSTDVTTKIFYESERGTTVYSGRPIKWTGRVGLMYPSDYGYATSGGATTNRDTCIHTSLDKWNGSGVSDCKNNDWLLYTSAAQWTLMSSINSNAVFDIYPNSLVSNSVVTNKYVVLPVLYLESNIRIEKGGVGASTSPFVLK